MKTRNEKDDNTMEIKEVRHSMMAKPKMLGDNVPKPILKFCRKFSLHLILSLLILLCYTTPVVAEFRVSFLIWLVVSIVVGFILGQLISKKFLKKR